MSRSGGAPLWIFFDLDGTLWDHEASCERAIRVLSERYGLSPMPFLSLFRKNNLALWPELMAGRIDFPTLNVRRFEQALQQSACGCSSHDAVEISEFYLRNYLDTPHPLPGARESLRYAVRGASLAILTNGQRFTQEVKLTHLGPEADLISFMLCAGDVAAVKPEDAFFEEALRLAGDPPRESVLMVGDHWEEDVVRAEAFGFRAAWLSHGRPVPEGCAGRIQIVRDIRGLPELLDPVEAG